MTQQSLIVRLKIVEEALAEVLAAERATNRPPSTVMEAEAKLDRIRAAAKQADSALSDLRELIKEAEGQEYVGTLSVEYFRGCKGMKNTYFDPVDNDLPEGRHLLYTALGEKP